MKNSGINNFTVNFSVCKKTVILLLAISLFCLIASHRAEAAIAYDNASESAGGSGTSLSWNHTVNSDSDSILVVGVSWRNMEDYTYTVNTVTYNSQGLTEIRKDEQF
jgi:hypothetical protein